MISCKKDFPTISQLTISKDEEAHFLLVDLADALQSPESRRRSNAHFLDSSVEKALYYAFQAEKPDAQHAVQFALDELLRLRFYASTDRADMSPSLFSAQQKIIERTLEHDKKSIEEKHFTNTGDFKEWFEQKCAQYKSGPHELFDYIERRAGVNGFRHLITQEAGVHVAFDDVLAAAQIGTRGQRKSEFFENLKDEIGSGDPDKFHLTMFGRLMAELEIESIDKKDLSWPALACGNYMMFLSGFRSLHHECTGYLGFLEALTPNRFGKIARGGIRLGLSESAMAFHSEHSELDIEHAEGWLNNLILPAVRENPALGTKIAMGVSLREKVSARYWDVLLKDCLEADGLAMRADKKLVPFAKFSTFKKNMV